MKAKITPTERAVSWRKDRQAEGYRQKAFLLSPAALASLKALGTVYGSEREALEVLLARSAKRAR